MVQKVKDNGKVSARCSVCGKRIKVYPGREELCRVHYEEAHEYDFSKLCDFIINGGKNEVHS